MKQIFILLLFSVSFDGFSQWTTVNIPQSGRYDDVFFINDSVGWAAGGNSNKIYKTLNGGLTWANQLTAPGKYLRSIEFATPMLGFCGSLDSSFFKTTDGGQTWIDIANTINPKPPGICGLSAPAPNVIYGVGIYSSPAYIIKSADGGNTWTTIDLTALAKAIVEVHFISADTGFVAGKATPESDGGIILYTTDGGATWAVKHKTLTPDDYIWKIQSPDGIHYFGSVTGIPTTANVRIVKSANRGMTWTTNIVSSTYSYNQTVGFINPLLGWTGGDGTLFQTTDGGLTWTSLNIGSAFNRFLKVNDSTAFLTGRYIYKYRSSNITGLTDSDPFDEIHTLSIFPNPASNIVNIRLKVKNRTYCKFELFSANGKLLQTITDNPIEKGIRNFKVDIENYPAQTLYFVLRTNEGMIYRRIIKN